MIRCTLALTAALALSTAAVGAQDNTVKSKTQVSADDARLITMTGCLERSGRSFTLRNAKAGSSDEVTTSTKVETDVDDNGAEVTQRSTSKVEHDDLQAVGTAGLITSYELTPQQGVDLSAHVGKQVQISAIAFDRKSGDDDAEVTVKEKTTIERDDAPDAKIETRTKAEVPRGKNASVAVVSVKALGSTCVAQ